MIAAEVAESAFSVQWGALGLAAVLLTLNGFFVAAEFALLAARRSRIEQLAADGDKRAVSALAGIRELTLMLADAAAETQYGPLKDFAMTEDDRYELKIAGWLHDCGKVTTPDYVVDKATKLETITDRIHEVRMRFEVLKLERTVAYQAKLIAGVGEPEFLKTELEKALAQIDDDYYFITECNRGGESMADVIFNGSSARKPTTQASVELIFDNSSGKVGGEYASFNEVGIKRQVTRDGQSNYYLNGTKCRRKDITDIFLGTGLGPRSYAIIEQGMISRLIEARPEDLRIFIEEAAGISKDFGDRSIALVHLKDATQLDPTHSAAWSLLAVLQENNGDYREAILTLSKALEHFGTEHEDTQHIHANGEIRAVDEI